MTGTLRVVFQRNSPRYPFIIPSRISSRGYKIGPVRLCVCLLFSVLTAEVFDTGTLKICYTTFASYQRHTILEGLSKM